MKNLNNKGFVLAETLIVCVFLMVIFTMIYTNFYPIVGEYEARENYDDVDGKYTAYWIKKMIESDDYVLSAGSIRRMNVLGFTRFQCKDMKEEKRVMCSSLVNALNISRCDAGGNNCDIYITKFKIDSDSSSYGTEPTSFKAAVRARNQGGTINDDLLINLGKDWEFYYEDYNQITNLSGRDAHTGHTFHIQECCTAEWKKRGLTGAGTLSCFIPVHSQGTIDAEIPSYWQGENPNYSQCYHYSGDSQYESTAEEIARFCIPNVVGYSFLDPTKDYILSLPNFNIYHESTKARFRVIVAIDHNKQGEKDQYSFATLEVVR